MLTATKLFSLSCNHCFSSFFFPSKANANLANSKCKSPFLHFQKHRSAQLDHKRHLCQNMPAFQKRHDLASAPADQVFDGVDEGAVREPPLCPGDPADMLHQRRVVKFAGDISCFSGSNGHAKSELNHLVENSAIARSIFSSPSYNIPQVRMSRYLHCISTSI